MQPFKNLRQVKVKESQKIGDGSYAKVYRISQRRVVKVYFKPEKIAKTEIENEITGSKLSKYALPVLEVVRVISRDSELSKYGVIRRYIPHEVTQKEANKVKKHLQRYDNPLYQDCHQENVRKDSRGKYFVVDTQIIEAGSGGAEYEKSAAVRRCGSLVGNSDDVLHSSQRTMEHTIAKA